MTDQTIAFIGLGNMGGPMCGNLVNAGATVATSAGDAVQGADVAITMLPAGKFVIEVWSAILPAMKPGALIIDCSTIDVDSARKAHELAKARGVESLDAPVSGGVGGAKGATLAFMAGGTDTSFKRAEPILAKMGRRSFHCGGAGAGQSAKICNNMLLAISMIGVSEALTLGERLGLSHQVMFDVMTASSGKCWSLESYCPVPGPVPSSPANNDYKPGFATNLMLKDVRLSQAAAQSSGVTTPLGDEAVRLYTAFAEAGGGDTDFSGIIRFLRDTKRSA